MRMRSWPLAMLCGIASCGWIAGIGSYGTRDDAGTVGSSDATRSSDASMKCDVDFGSGGMCPTSLTAGVGETCVIAPGGLYCWGQNNLDDSSPEYAPVQVQLNETPKSVQLSSSADPNNTISVGCYLQADGVLMCWGDSVSGQVQQIQPNAAPPTEMTPHGVTAYAVGADHVCSMSGSATVQCWGSTDEDELNSTMSGSACVVDDCSPTAVDTENIEAAGPFVAGQAHTCVSPNAHVPMDPIGCWGANESGQLGGGFGESPSMITEVVGVTDDGNLGSATELALGASHTCAIVAGVTYCWGANEQGQLGNSSVGGLSLTPVGLTGAPALVHIAAGTNTTCGIDTGGAVWCWGDNTQGQAGQGPGSINPMPPEVDQPTMVANISNATMIAVGNLHACAALVDGDIMCWGDNHFGELGDNNHTHLSCMLGDCSPTPVLVTKP
jgi:alpha-tubulin suppressor-like RCC1 family protein